jgi:hypothetical protein
VQNRHSASKKNHPRACRPFPSVYSLTSEIMVSSLPYFLTSLLPYFLTSLLLATRFFSANLSILCVSALSSSFLNSQLPSSRAA